MKISFLIPAIVLNVVRLAFSNNVQVGTVLFTTTDLVKKCWTDYDKSLLRARAIMQDVLPHPDCLDFSNPEAVVTLLDYFHACYQIISTSTYGRVQNLLFVAMSDAFGGYLRAHVLPYTKKSYYAGVVKYAEAKKLFTLYDDIKNFLKTDGMGWAPPPRFGPQEFRVKPLEITEGTARACRDLFIIEAEGKPQYMDPTGEDDPRNSDNNEKSYGKFSKSPKQWRVSMDILQQAKSKKRSPKTSSDSWDSFKMEERQLNDSPNPHPNASEPGQAYSRNTTPHDETRLDAHLKSYSYNPKPQEQTRQEELRKGDAPKVQAAGHVKTVIVPLPMLDDQEAPNSIAVPLRKLPLRNLKAESSADVLETYYTSVIKCFIGKGSTRNDIKNFNGQFYCWLTSKVLPHLGEEQWYPGFGGVLRVMETIKLLGLHNTYRGGECRDYGFLFEEGGEFEVDSSFNGKARYRDVEDIGDLEDVPTPPKKRKNLLIYALASSLTTLLLLLLFLLIYCICRKRRKNPQHVHYNQQQEPGPSSNFMSRLFKPKTPPHELDEIDHRNAFCATCAGFSPITEEEKRALQALCQNTPGSRKPKEDHELVNICQNCPGYVKPPIRDPEEQKAMDAFCENCAGYRPIHQSHEHQTGQESPKKREDIRVSRHHHEAHFFTQHTKSPFEAPRRLHNVYTLWKKPSYLMNRYWTSDETKYYSSEVRTTTCHSTETCHGPTDSSITTKAQKRKSSTITFLEVKGNESTRSSTQCSTMESGSENSYSSEYSVSSKGSKRKHRNSKNYP